MMSGIDKKNRQNTTTKTNIIMALVILSISSFSSSLYANGQEEEKEPLFITMKVKLIEDPSDFTNLELQSVQGENIPVYNIYNVTTANNIQRYMMKALDQNISDIEYDFKNSYTYLTEDNTIYWRLAYTIIDNITTPNITQTKYSNIASGAISFETYNKRVDTATNTTIYNLKNNAYINDEFFKDENILDSTNITLQLFSDNTGILTITEEMEGEEEYE